MPVGYKVTAEGPHSTLKSSSINGEKATIYPVGDTVCRVDGNGPLALFSSIKDARTYADQMQWVGTKVWEAMYIPSRDEGLWVKGWASVEALDVAGDIFRYLGIDVVDPIIYADAVHLIREIER